jgi:DNA-binding transcriptional regulator YiaG
MGGKKVCPECGAAMWGCGTFGLMWNCPECGWSEEGTEAEQGRLNAFIQAERDRVERPEDVIKGARLRVKRLEAGVALSTLAERLGVSASELSAWEFGRVAMQPEEEKDYLVHLEALTVRGK